MTRARELAELATSYDSGSSLGFRNRIINGDMRIDQRNNGAAVANLDGYLVDRWMAPSFGAAPVGRVTGQRSTLAPAGFQNSFQLTVTTPSTSLAATEAYLYRQMIEGLNIADLGWGTASAVSVTASFWARSSVTGNYTVALNNGGVTRAYVAQFTINLANTWEYKTVTIPGDTTGTWATDNTVGIQFIIGLSGGTSRTQSAGSWQNASIPMTCATGQTNWIGTNGATFYTTGVQLEAGTVASPFERRDYGRELIMCQRYCWTGNSTVYGYYGFGGNWPNSGWISFPVTMRTAPTVTFGSATSVSLTNSESANYIATNGFAYTVNVTSTGTMVRVNPTFATAEL